MEDKVLDIVEKICEDEIVREDLNVDLFETGLMDSLAFIDLMVELEKTFDITITPSDLDRSSINTPLKIIEFISNKER